MQKTIGKLKIGSRVLLGSYTAGNGAPEPVVWLKATPKSDFISEYALDFLCFDAKEPDSADNRIKHFGNSLYSVSNILSFANSEDEQWFVPKHETDNAPTRYWRDVNDQRAAYAGHKGFLYNFEDYEVASISMSVYIVDRERISSLIRLPNVEDIIGDERFNLFSKKGVRPKPTQDLIQNKSDIGYSDTSFIPFWCAGSQSREYSIGVKTIDRAGFTKFVTPSDGCGFRPVCTIDPNTIVEETSSGLFRIVPFGMSADDVITDEDLLTLLGLTP